MIIRPKVTEGKAIQQLVNLYAVQGLLIPLSLHDIYERIREFFVYKIEDQIVGVASLHVIWEDLAEVRSMAVHPDYQRRGIGKALVLRCLDEGRDLGIKQVFLLTYKKEFFEKVGFQLIDKSKLPQKVWSDCIKCVKFPDCDEIAMSIML
ncbi:MAG: N-acetyltransferase [bacterium]|nr:N-acetyltransferase [bacterium]